MNLSNNNLIKKLNQLILNFNNELSINGLSSVEYFLFNNEVEDTFQYIINNSELYGLITEDKVNSYIYKYLKLTKEYYNQLLVLDEHKINKYFEKLSQPSSIVYDKRNIMMPPVEINRTLRLFEEAFNVFEKLYNNKMLMATLKNDEEVMFQIRRREVLHLLGITTSNIYKNKDFLDLMGFKPGSRPNQEEIIQFMLSDFHTNQDVVAFEYDRVKNLINKPNYILASSQFKNNVTNELLNFPKIRLKSQAFIKSGPLEEVFMFAKLAEGKRLAKYSNSNSAMISWSEISKQNPWSYFGSVQESGYNYTETLIIDSAKGQKEKFNGAIPSIATKVILLGKDADEDGVVFSEEDQLELFIKAYEHFNKIMNFEGLKKDFQEKASNRKQYTRKRK